MIQQFTSRECRREKEDFVFVLGLGKEHFSFCTNEEISTVVNFVLYSNAFNIQLAGF